MNKVWKIKYGKLPKMCTHLVLFLLQHQDDVARLHPRRLVRLTAKGDLLAVLHALVHVHLQDLHLLHHLLAFALFTAVLLADHLA